MKKLLTLLSRRRFPYDPLICVELSRSNLIHNLDEFRKIAPGGRVVPVLKSNAYGHGLFEIAEILQSEDGIPFFVVDSYFEAVALRSHGITTPLLIIGYSRSETILNSRLKRTAFTITSLESLREIARVRRPLNTHLKIDTGMHRQGILQEEITDAISIIRKNPNIILDGITSHLSDADNIDKAFTEKQISRWNSVVQTFKKDFSALTYIHLSATDGHKYTPSIDANVSRIGIGLYGLTDGELINPELDLKPVMEIRTIITGVKKLSKGETIGYGNTFTAPHDMIVATIPFGYFEGLDRRLSNKGSVLVGEGRVPCPIIGRISMNISSIDVSGVPGSHTGTSVIVISKNVNDPNSISSMLKLLEDTITYELAVHIPSHLKRIVI